LAKYNHGNGKITKQNFCDIIGQNQRESEHERKELVKSSEIIAKEDEMFRIREFLANNSPEFCFRRIPKITFHRKP